MAGQGTKILASNEDDLRNIDELILEHCKIDKPKYSERARALCMEFCYFERTINIYKQRGRPKRKYGKNQTVESEK